MSKECCEYHDRLPEEFKLGQLPDAFADGCECGLAGMGSPAVCCRDCPHTKWFVENRGIPIDRIIFAKEICAPTSPKSEPIELERFLSDYIPVEHRDDDYHTCASRYHECSYKGNRVSKTMVRFAEGVYCIAKSYEWSDRAGKPCNHPAKFWNPGKCDCGAEKSRNRAKKDLTKLIQKQLLEAHLRKYAVTDRWVHMAFFIKFYSDGSWAIMNPPTIDGGLSEESLVQSQSNKVEKKK